MNKKGQTPGDVILLISMLGMLAIGGLVSVLIANSVYDAAAETPPLNESTKVMEMFESSKTVANKWDYVITFLLIGFAIALIIIGYFIDVHTVFLPLFILMLLIGLIVVVAVSYAWDQVANTTTFTAIKTASFPITDHLMNNLAIYYTIIGAMSLVATYAKTRNENAI